MRQKQKMASLKFPIPLLPWKTIFQEAKAMWYKVEGEFWEAYTVLNAGAWLAVTTSLCG